MNGNAINRFAGITDIKLYCPGKQGRMVPLDVRETEGSEMTLQAWVPRFMESYTAGSIHEDV